MRQVAGAPGRVAAVVIAAMALVLAIAPPRGPPLPDRSAVALAVPASRPLRTRNVILVTVDGLRIQELFAGMDAIVSRNPKRSGIYDPRGAREILARYAREAPRGAPA